MKTASYGIITVEKVRNTVGSSMFAFRVSVLEQEGFPPIRRLAENRMVHLGCPVQFSGGQSAEGIVTGLGDQGELLLRLKDQSLLPVTCGDVSVRGVNGYV